MKNKGLHSHRLQPGQNNPREVAFAEQWDFEQVNNQILNSLVGLGPHKEITDRDKEVAATLMQWLGSNVGMSFIIESMRREPEIRKFLRL